MRLPLRGLRVVPLLPFLLAGCGDDDDGMGPGTGTGQVTLESLETFWGTTAPDIRDGLLDGFTRLLDATEGGVPDGVTITPTGANSYDMTIDLDLDGDGTLRGSRDTSLPMSVALSGDPTDGIQDSDLPATVQIPPTSTAWGTYSGTATVTAQGGGPDRVTIFLVEGTATVTSGSRTEAHEFGYSADFTFPGLPIHGWEYIEVSGAGSAEYEVCYRFAELGGQYVKVFGTVNGAAFTLEFGSAPAPEDFPCEL